MTLGLLHFFKIVNKECLSLSTCCMSVSEIPIPWDENGFCVSVCSRYRLTRKTLIGFNLNVVHICFLDRNTSQVLF